MRRLSSLGQGVREGNDSRNARELINRDISERGNTNRNAKSYSLGMFASASEKCSRRSA